VGFAITGNGSMVMMIAATKTILFIMNVNALLKIKKCST